MTLFPSSNILASFPSPVSVHTLGEPGNKASNILVCLLLFHVLLSTTVSSAQYFCVTTILCL